MAKEAPVLRGYRLHDKRIDFSRGTGSMRTIKYELTDSASQPGGKAAVCDAVTHDYHGIYGPMTVADWLGDADYPSMLEFWLHCLRLGVWFGKNEATAHAAFAAYKGKTVGWYVQFDQLAEQLRTVLDRNAWCEFMGKDQRGLEKKAHEAREKIILNLVAKGIGPDNLTALQGLASTYADGIIATKDARAFKAEIFGVDAPQLESGNSDFALTWTIDPDVPEVVLPDMDSVTGFIESVMQRYQSVTFDTKEAQAMMGVGSNGNYLNNIFGTAAAYLLSGKISELADYMAGAYDYDHTQRQIIAARLDFLAGYMQRLGSPKMVRRWSEYRGMFNGTLESWFSNRSSKHDKAIEQLIATRQALGELIVLAESDDSSLSALAEELQAVVHEALASGAVTQEGTATIRILMGELRSELNVWAQSKDVAGIKELRRVLDANIQSAPMFFGVSQAQRYRKLRTAKHVTLAQIKVLTILFEAISTGANPDALVDNRTVDMMARAANRAEDVRARDVFASAEQAMGCVFAERTDKERFYISGYERQEGLRLLPHKDVLLRNLLEAIGVRDVLVYASEHIADGTALRDVSALLKPVLAAVLAAVPTDYAMRVSLFEGLTLTDRQRDLLVRNTHGGGLSNKVISLLLVYMFSELSGFAALTSRSEFVLRAAVQATNGTQMTLGYEVYEKAKNTHRRYYAQAAGVHAETDCRVDNLMLTRQAYNYDKSAFRESSQPAGVLLAIRSSRYQVQFLEWFLGCIGRRKGSLRAGGSFTVLEQTATLDWAGDVPKIVSRNDHRLFLSQPFTIVPPDHERQRADTGRYLGVDIGEYVLAWTVIEVVGDNVHVVASGELQDGQHRALASRVRQLKERQVRATFSMPSTRVARLRESLTATYRNQMEALAMKYDARLCFEYEVSAFETGGSRIVKVYDSLKRADVLKKDNNPQNVQAWGKARKAEHSWAVEITAAGTSQTCSKCLRWASLLINPTKPYQLRPHAIKGLCIATIDDGSEVVCYAPKCPDSMSGKELKGAIYKAMRPNIGGAAMNLVPAAMRASFDDSWRMRRGNIAVYVCPFLDCHHVSDADLQAAFNIAMRGFLKTTANGPGLKFTKEWFTERQRACSFEPIVLEIS